MFFTELKFLRVESAAPESSLLQECTHSVEVLLYGIVIQQAIVYTVLDILEVSHDLSLPVSVPITRADQTLWGSAVAIPAPHCDKSRQMTVSWVKGNTVIPVPAVYGRLDLLARYRGDNGPRCFCVVSLPGCKLIKWSKIYNTPGFAITFRRNNHTVTPRHRVINWNFFQNTKLTISVQAPLHILLPM